MKKSLKITLAIICSLLIIAIFAGTCACTYIFDWSKAFFWWTWFILVWLVDLFVGGYIFYKHNRTDETKMFWLLAMIILPIIGGVLALIFNYKLKSQYTKPDNDHTKLQEIIFKARKSIKIYSNSFFVSNDTFKALNFARWKGIRIQLIISIQKSKQKQALLIYNLQKMLEDKMELHMTSKQIVESFVMIDDHKLICTNKNFNFKNLYQDKNIRDETDLNKYQRIWQNDLARTSYYPLERDKVSGLKRAWFKLINIFYPFF